MVVLMILILSHILNNHSEEIAETIGSLEILMEDIGVKKGSLNFVLMVLEAVKLRLELV
jgi:hypothetical protein